MTSPGEQEKSEEKTATVEAPEESQSEAKDPAPEQVSKSTETKPPAETKPTGGGTLPPPSVPISKLPRGPIVVGLPVPTRPPSAPRAPTAPAKPVTKKRKLPPTTAPAPVTRPALATAPPPLTDPTVVKAVHDILGLLQNYGPLTMEQLEYNLPPQYSSNLKDIVQLLVATGVVQVVDDDDGPTRYTTLHGMIRAQVVMPHRVVDEILEAQEQAKRSLERAETLRQALLSSDDEEPKAVLQQLFRNYPEIAQDPVYMAAFRNVQVDVGGVERDRSKQKEEGKKEETEQKSKEGTADSSGKGTGDAAPSSDEGKQQEVTKDGKENTLLEKMTEDAPEEKSNLEEVKSSAEAE